ncbi:MAG: ankyrin repeat domain-containing protein [Legionellaceae bacterium]|nr:ankyrin repeat domain-containing protein [Legionellaceae bacterium]
MLFNQKMPKDSSTNITPEALSRQIWKQRRKDFVERYGSALREPKDIQLIRDNPSQPKLPDGIDINSRERDIPGFTFLHNEAISNNKEALLWLIHHYKADVLIQCYHFGDTALMWAIASTSIDTALALMDETVVTQPEIMNQQINLPCHSMHTPLILSIGKGWTHVESGGRCKQPQSVIASRLLALGADVNAVDNKQRSALHYAYLHRNPDAIRALLDAGAREDLKDIDGKIPLDMQDIPGDAASDLLASTFHFYTLESKFFCEKSSSADTTASNDKSINASAAKPINIDKNHSSTQRSTKNIFLGLMVAGAMGLGLGALAYLNFAIAVHMLALITLNSQTMFLSGSALCAIGCIGFFNTKPAQASSDSMPPHANLSALTS